MKRLRILIALLSVLALLLTSCGTPPDNGGDDEVGGDEIGGNTNTEGGGNGNEDGNEEDDEPAPPVDGVLELFSNTETEYTIVYNIRDNAAYEFSKLLADYIEESFGVNISMKSVGMDTAVAEKEIIVGNTRSLVSFVTD